MRSYPVLRLAGLALAMATTSYCALVLISIFRAFVHREPIGPHLLWANPIEWDVLHFVAPLYLAMLLVELVSTGWRDSSLRRLALARDRSAYSDLAYTVFNFSGLARIMGIVLLFGIGNWLGRVSGASTDLPAETRWPLWVELPALALWSGFWSYWLHRAMHSRLMWPLHKSHHSAEAMTILTSEREHPLESVLSNVSSILIPASLGVSLDAVAIFGIVVTVSGMLQHSNVAWANGLERFGLFTAAGHRLHHAAEARFHDRNFGEMLNLWDRLFGTYAPPPPDAMAIPIGVEAAADRHNTGNPVREVALQTSDWLAPLRRSLASAMRAYRQA